MIKINQISYLLMDKKALPTKQEELKFLKSFVKNNYHIEDTSTLKIAKKSLDSRKNKPLAYIYAVTLELDKNKEEKLIKKCKSISEVKDDETLKYIKNLNSEKDENILVCGMGPSGLFCAYLLNKAGFKVTLIDRGSSVEERINQVEEFFNTGKLSSSNVQFGEGGAGTFSDGKLGTNVSNPLINYIYEIFHNYGASEEILYDAHPHIGTDKLRIVVKNMRDDMIKKGVKVLFNTQLIDIKENKAIVKNNEETYPISFDSLVLAIGHSAVDTYELLNNLKMEMAPKPFSMGVRIEHLQEDINVSQYHGKYDFLPPADYKLFTHLSNGRCVYTFCMCPGGYVVNASSEEGYLVTNGMSNEARENINSNSALLVNVNVDDFYKGNPLDGVYFQKHYEKKAYDISSNYFAPTTIVKDFLNGVASTKIGDVTPTIKPGYTLCDISECLPEFVSSSLKEGIVELDKKLKGFANPNAVLTAIESRSSSPVRLVRDNNYMTSIKDVYAIGEGAGYAGGITTSALDGLKCALKLIKGDNNE